MKFNQIFVVDDDKIHHFMIKKLLQNNQIEVNPSFFENGFEAINGLKNMISKGENPPDLILLDINMPILDGWQFLEEFKAIKTQFSKEIVIHIITSSEDKQDFTKAEYFKEEIDKYYTKPVTGALIKDIFQ
ncbi:response regulator [Flavobacterium sp. TBRC 19031]|uniref:response regulator n=1 Tax=Flavobacterium mekongense TaxID=3379707 RepID=UPI00399B98F3